MLESAEVGHAISKASYAQQEPRLREALLNAARLAGTLDKAAFEVYLQEMRSYERMLFDEGVVILKFWIHLSKGGLSERMRDIKKSGLHKPPFELDYHLARKYHRLRPL